MVDQEKASDDSNGPLPQALQTLRDGILKDRPELVKAGLEEFFAAFPNLTTRQLANRLGRKDRAIQVWRQKGKGPRPDIIAPLFHLYRELRDQAEGMSFEEVAHVDPEIDIQRPSKRIRIGVPPVWDSAIYTAFDQILQANGIVAEFGFLRGWTKEDFSELEEGRFDALIHNYFVLSAAHHEPPYPNLRMSHGLYIYQGQFIFASRPFLESLESEDAQVRNDIASVLEGREWGLRKQKLSFPKLSSPKAIGAVLSDPRLRLAYLTGTDNEEVMRRLHCQAFGPNYDWAAASDRHECRKTRDVQELIREFERGTFNVMCGGVPLFWKYANSNFDEFITLCDPQELDTPSLNGLVVLNDRLADMRYELDAVAGSFYSGIRSFREWYQSFVFSSPSDPQDAEGRRTSLTPRAPLACEEHLLHMARVAVRAPLLGAGDLGESAILKGEEPLLNAWAWARLMMRYVDFFSSAKQVNEARKKPEMRDYANHVQQLIERA